MSDKSIGGDVSAWHLRAVRLPDGERPEDWWVCEGRLTREPVPGARELPGGWVAPGLVDAHVHLSMDVNRSGLPDGSVELLRFNLDAQRDAGVLALRDAGEVPGAQPPPADSQAPLLQRSGRFLAPAGGFHQGLHIPVAAGELISVALAEVARGARWVKIIADFPGPDWNWGAPRSNYPPELVRELVIAVHAAGARVMAHTTGPIVAELVRAGVDSIEHGTCVEPELVRAMAAQGTAWTPTLATTLRYLGAMVVDRGPAGVYARERLERFRETIPLAQQLGLTLLAGTDEEPHGSLALEVVALQRQGLAPAAALAAASTAARAYLGLSGLTAGAPADLVLFAVDPRRDLSALARPAAVLRQGHLAQGR